MNGGRRPCSVHRWRPQRAPQLRTTCSRSRSEAVKLNVMECSVARGWGESRTWVKLDAKASLTTSEKSKDSGNVTTQCSFRVPSRLPRNLLKLMHKTWGRERSLTPWRRFFFLNVRVSVFKYHHSEMKKSFTHLDGVCVPHFGQKQQFSPRSSSCRKYDFKQPSWESSKRYEATGLALASAVCCHRYDSTRFSDLAGTQTFHLVPTCFFFWVDSFQDLFLRVINHCFFDRKFWWQHFFLQTFALASYMLPRFTACKASIIGYARKPNITRESCSSLTGSCRLSR